MKTSHVYKQEEFFGIVKLLHILCGKTALEIKGFTNDTNPVKVAVFLNDGTSKLYAFPADRFRLRTIVSHQIVEEE